MRSQGFSELRSVVEDSERNFREYKPGEWLTNRPLRHDPETHDEAYGDVLPTYTNEFGKTKTFLDVIGEKIEAGQQVRWLDIGCGTGRALLEARELFPPESLDLVGLGSSLDLDRPFFDVRGVLQDPTRSALENGDIKFVHGGFIGCEPKVHPPFDVITAVYSTMYVGVDYPTIKIYQKIHRMLKDEGYAFIYPLDIPDIVFAHNNFRIPFDQFQRQCHGIDIKAQDRGVVMRRNVPVFPLDFEGEIYQMDNHTIKLRGPVPEKVGPVTGFS